MAKKAAKNLVIVESPAKAKTIGKYLGPDYEVMASMGHLRDLPKSKIGVDVDKDFELDYKPIKGKEEILLAIADRMGEQTEAWMRTVRDDPGLTGAEKLQKMFRASLENSDQTDLFVLAPNMLKNPKLMSILLESMIGEVLPNYMEPVLREAVADGSIRTDYPEELGELPLLLSNAWVNPMIYPATPEKTRRRMELYDEMLRSMGLDLLDQELLNQWEQFCRLSQERL